MASLTLGNIPNHINTHERLLVWAAMALQSACNGKTAAVIPNQGSSPLCQVQMGVAADNTTRFVVSAYIPLDPTLLAQPGEKLWMAATEATASAPNGNYMAN